MDDDGLSMRNWGYYEPSFKEHLGLQLMSPMGDHRDTKPFLMNPNAAPYQHPGPDPRLPMHYMRDGWIQRERLLHMPPGNPSFTVFPDSSTSHSMHIMPPLDSSKTLEIEDSTVAAGGASLKKRAAPKAQRAKKPKKPPCVPKENTNSRSRSVKKNMDVVINGMDMDISGIPIPICSCTGVPQQCYRWGSGGWQSACCTTTISMYPLPMSTKRRGARIAGRKMSQGAFKKVLEKLASQSYNFANAIDLRGHWAKHGTNKFVTIR